jgi:hypothetical protein
MAMKWKYLDLNIKLKVICLCEVCGSSMSKLGRQLRIFFDDVNSE